MQLHIEKNLLLNFSKIISQILFYCTENAIIREYFFVFLEEGGIRSKNYFRTK